MPDILKRLDEAIEQTVPVEGLQTEAFLHETYLVARDEIVRLREVLRFYSNVVNHAPFVDGNPSPLTLDGGKRARRALAGAKSNA
jgi:hypothetical protein